MNSERMILEYNIVILILNAKKFSVDVALCYGYGLTPYELESVEGIIAFETCDKKWIQDKNYIN